VSYPRYILAFAVLSSSACVASQCCLGSGQSTAPLRAKTAAECIGECKPNDCWLTFHNCTAPLPSCTAIKCTGDGSTSYGQFCQPADPTLLQNAIDGITPQFPGLRCSIFVVGPGSSEASSLRSVESYFSLVMATYAFTVILKKVK
jgi:hypothetical protein